MLRAELGKISTSYLRRMLRESGVPLGPLVEGVRQETFEGEPILITRASQALGEVGQRREMLDQVLMRERGHHSIAPCPLGSVR